MKVISVCSCKGGVGKTTVAALLIKHLALGSTSKYSILAIDADPDTNLPDVLGVKVEKNLPLCPLPWLHTRNPGNDNCNTGCRKSPTSGSLPRLYRS